MSTQMIEMFPLSPQQRRVWELGPAGGATPFRAQCAILVEGALDTETLKDSLLGVVARHEILRTTFREAGEAGTPGQAVSDCGVSWDEFHDISRRDEGLQQIGLGNFLRGAEELMLHVERGPLMRVSIVKLSEARHVLHVTLPALCADAPTLRKLTGEIARAYAARAGGVEPEEQPLQYADVSQWLNELLESEEMRVGRDDWRRQAGGRHGGFRLAFEKAAPPAGGFEPKRDEVELGGELLSKIEGAAEALGTRPELLLHAAWQVLLWNHGQRPDEVVIGTAYDGLNYEELADALGPLTKYIPIRCRLDADSTFGELVGQTAARAQEAYDRQQFYFAEETTREGEAGAEPFYFPFCFDFDDEGGPAEAGGLTLSIYGKYVCTDRFKLKLVCTRRRGALLAELHYDAGLFSQADAGGLASQFRTLLAGAVEGVGTQLGRLPLLSEEGRRLMLQAARGPAAPRDPDLCAHDLFAARAALAPDALALSCGPVRLSYGELDARAERLAKRLRAAGVRPGCLVALCLERSADLVVALLGILKAGGAYLPLDPSYPSNRLAFMLEDAAAPFLLTRAALRDALPPHDGQTLLLDDAGKDSKRKGGKAGARRGARPGDLAYVIYTSGSTGRPKGVMVSHGGLVNLVEAQARAFGLGPSDRVLQFASISFDASVSEIFVTLCAGASLHLSELEPAQLGARLVEVLREERITAVTLPPSLLAVTPHEELPELRTLVVAGEACTAELVARWGRGRRFLNAYGPTEITVCATVAECAPDGRRPPVGRAIANAAAYVLDFQLEPVPAGVAGELHVGGAGVARGYLKRPALTAERFIPDPFSAEPGARLYRTGDMARYLPDGQIEFVGRVDHQVKLRGFRVELGEVEAALLSHPSVRECVVIDREAAVGDTRLVACVVAGAGGEELTGAALREHAQQHLPGYMLPAEWVWLEKLPLTGNGKVDRKALRALAESGGAGEAVEYVAPRTATEELMCGVWQELLRVERVGVNDNFFGLGGHSLLATQIISRIRDALSVELALQDIFDHQTVAGLSAHVELEAQARRGLRLPPIERAPRDGELAPSFAQTRLWFLNQLEPESLLHNSPVMVPLGGDLDVRALEQTFDEIIRRHEVFRTTFENRGGRPVQVIAPRQEARLAFVDLSGLGEAVRESEFARVAKEEMQGLFDLQRGPLLRIKLVKVEESQHVLIFTTHHIIIDGWSVGVLTDELTALYRAFVEGRPSPLPELKVQYADFAHWQRNWLRGEALEQLLGYWRERLGPRPATLELPTDRPRPAFADYDAVRSGIVLPRHLTEPLRALCRREGVTLYMLLLAGFKAMLHRYTGQEEIVVGTDIANRNRAEIEGLIGFFVNQLVLRTDLSGDPTFRELLGRVREVCLGAYAHQDMPFEYLVEELQPERDFGRSPFFQVKLVVQNTPAGKLEARTGGEKDSRRLSPGDVQTQTQLDLTISLTETGDTISGTVEYRVSLFDAATIERLTGHYVRCLEALVADPSTRVSDVPLLSEEEGRLLLREWNDTRAHYPRGSCLHHLVEGQATATPERVALVFGEERVTYADLNRRANRLARRLRRLGVGPEAGVAVCLERSAEMVVALLAVLKAGGFYVPLDPAYPRERVNFILEDSGARVLLTQSGLSETLPRTGAVVVHADDEDDAREEETDLRVGVAPENLAYVIYTSGSTGRPKGVQVTHRSVVNFITSMSREPGIGRDDVLLAVTTLSFDIAALEIYLPLTAGAVVVVAGREVTQDPQALAAEAGRAGATVMQATPSTWRMLLESGWQPSPGLRMLCGGEQLGRELARQLAAPGCALWNMYGPTESTVWSSLARVEHGDVAVTLGRPIANTDFYVLDARTRPVPVGVTGELFIGGDGLARGYLHRPALTAERFVPDPFSSEPGARLYRTGDRVRYLADGRVEYLGRADFQVKVRGFRIELGEVEAALSALADVSEAAADVREDARGEKHLVAYFVAREGQRPGSGELRAQLRTKLPEYMIPSIFVQLDALPLTPNGKLDRRGLPEPAQTQRDASQVFVAPRDELEGTLAGIWSEVLGAGEVGIFDNFFDLGGHSLLATQVISRVREAFGVKLPLRELFTEPTVAGLAESIKTAMNGGEVMIAPPLRPVPRDGAAPVTFNQERRIERDRLNGSMPTPMSECFVLRGPLDADALERSLNEICARHEALRTVFKLDGDEPLQLILPPSPFALPLRDLSGLRAQTRRDAAVRAAREEVSRPFDLSEGPLFRALLIRQEPEEHLLVLCAEHIVCDAWSQGVLNRELATLYTAFVEGRPSPLPELKVQYADFAHWQRDWLRGEALDTFLGYWRKQLGGTIPEMEFPTDRPRRTRAEGGGSGVARLDMPLALAESVRELARKEGATFFMATLAAFNTLLLHHTEREDISLLSPIAGRSHVETEQLIGWFNNILVLRTDLSGDPTFTELLARTRRVTLDAYAHQDIPFALLVKDMQPDRDTRPTPPAQIYFDLITQGEGQAARDGREESAGGEGGRLSFERMDLDQGGAQLDLNFRVADSPRGLAVRLTYMQDLFEPSTVERLLENYQALLERIVATPQARLSELRVV